MRIHEFYNEIPVGSRGPFAQGGRDARADHLDGPHELDVRQRRHVHLKRDARDAAQGLAVSHDLLDDLVRVADQERAVRTALRVEARPGHGRPSALLPDVGDGTGVAREELIRGLPCRRGHITERVDADFQPIRAWFADYVRWLTTHSNGIEERLPVSR